MLRNPFSRSSASVAASTSMGPRMPLAFGKAVRSEAVDGEVERRRRGWREREVADGRRRKGGGMGVGVEVRDLWVVGGCRRECAAAAMAVAVAGEWEWSGGGRCGVATSMGVGRR